VEIAALRIRRSTGRSIAAAGMPTHVFVLADFDAAGDTIFESLAQGTKDAPGGLSRFTEGVPVYVHRLALTLEQIKDMELPTRLPNYRDPRTKKFVEKYGHIAAELDAMSPVDLRKLVEDTIGQFMSEDDLEFNKKLEEHERKKIVDALERAESEGKPYWDPRWSTMYQKYRESNASGDE
jgi:hypothetical protein